MFEFEFTDSFRVDLENLDPQIQEIVKEKIHFFMGIENPLLCAKKMKGKKGIFRFRIGDYRIMFLLSGRKIFLLKVQHRKDVYRDS